MKLVRSIRRSILLLVHVFWGLLVLLFIVSADPDKRTDRDWRAIQNWMARLCRILGIRVIVEGAPAKSPVLFVSNHISWYDIPVLQSAIPTGFVSKAEIRNWPVIGWMAYRGNTLFVQRGKRESFLYVLQYMKRRLNGQNLLVFPEGTTSSGDTVLNFKTRFYDPAIESHVPIQPIALYYNSPWRSCEELAFINHEPFVAHMLRLIGEPYIDAHLRFCTPVQTVGRDRHELGEVTQDEVEKALAAIKSRINKISHGGAGNTENKTN